jgi:hypothetical protein
MATREIPGPRMPMHASLAHTLWIFACFLVSGSAYGQDTTATAPPPAIPAPSAGITLRPSFGLGAGMFAFLGDVGSDHAGHSPLVSRFGFDLRATTPITPWLEGGLHALHGRLGVNERSAARNLNFESRITIGGFHFRYNFHHFLAPDRRVEPFLTLGFESVEFLTKTDLYDREGRAYNYWSDGTIRDLPEGAPNAADAVIIQRDYTYESDVRELNRDGFGKYAERTWAIPIGIGARMDLGGGFDFRLSTTMHYTFTDLVDGVTDQSVENRRGDARNDRFMYTSFSLGYALPMQRQPKATNKVVPLRHEQIDLIVLNDDEDGDGVPDMRDRCPHTPAGAKVDLRGCPVDGDRDLVPDHQDDELNSAPDAVVDHRGVTMTDEDHLKGYMNYLDSGNVTMLYSRVESFGPMAPKKQAPERTYVVKVGTQVEGISEDQIQRILSIPDVRTIERNDTTYYVVGNYEALPEALRRELELRGGGIEGMVMAEEAGKLIDISSDVVMDRARISGTGTFTGEPGRITIRVQLGAFRQRLSRNIFANIEDLVVINGEDGLTRYYTGSFTDVNEAARYRVKMLLNGFDGAFLVAFRDGKRISMREAGAATTATEDLRTLPSSSVNREMLRYRVQVATFAGNVPMEAMDVFLDIGNIKAVPTAGSVRYVHGNFTSRAEAEKARLRVVEKGFADAFVVGDMNGHLISVEDADQLLNKP